jgi:hypothetical protein
VEGFGLLYHATRPRNSNEKNEDGSPITTVWDDEWGEKMDSC